MPKVKESQVSEMKLSSVREIPPESIRISTSRTGEERDAQLARSRAEERYERSPAQIRRPVVIERPKDSQKKKEEEIASNSEKVIKGKGGPANKTESGKNETKKV